MAQGTGNEAGGNKFPPRVVGKNSVIALGNKRRASQMFQFLDIEKNRMRSFSVIDNGLDPKSGYWELKGKKLASGQWHTFTAAQLKNLKFVGGYATGEDRLQIRASDSDGQTERWSKADSFIVTTIGKNKLKPTISVADVKTLANEATRLKTLFKARDADNYKIIRYRVRYNGPGKLTLNGKRIKGGKWTLVNATALGGLLFEAPGFSKGAKTGKITAQAFDGRRWSLSDTGNVIIKANTKKPTLQAFDKNIARGETLEGHALLSARDSDGNTLKFVKFYDTGIAADGGYFTVNGVKQAARKWFTVAYTNLDKVVYHAADTYDKERFRVAVSDGRNWSTIQSADLTTITKPVISIDGAGGTDVIVVDEFDTLTAGQIFDQSDAGPTLKSYEVVDLNGAVGSGYFTLNGSVLAAGQVHTITAAQIGGLRFNGGGGDDRYLDDFMVRANNGLFWSDWTAGSVHTEPRMTPSLKQLGTWSPVAGRGLELTYSFMTRVPDYYAPDAQERTDFQTMNGIMRDSMRRALDVWSAVSGITFREVADTAGGVLRFGSADLGDDTIFGWAYGPDGVLSPNRLAGDVWLNWNTFLVDTADDMRVNHLNGTMNHLTTIHELGHALGLSHPFDQIIQLPRATDTRHFTVMSYTGPLSGNEPITPQLYDIAAIQEMYGRNTTTNVTNTVYSWTANQATVETIYDAGGTDTMNFANQDLNVTVDLRPGRFSSFARQPQSLMISYGTLIENVTGGDGDDQLTGNYAVNRIIGGKGADTIRGLDGNDFTSGGEGNDVYRFGVADGNDIIDEQLGGGRDTLRLDLTGLKINNPSEASFKTVVVARKVGLDLHVAMWPANGRQLSSVVIKNMGKGKSRVEAIELYDGNQKVGRTVDLDSIYVQATDVYRRFKITEFSSDIGQIAVRA